MWDRTTICARPEKHMRVQGADKVVEDPSTLKTQIAEMQRSLVANGNDVASDAQPLVLTTARAYMVLLASRDH